MFTHYKVPEAAFRNLVDKKSQLVEFKCPECRRAFELRLG
jgi:hypothetical protein